MTALDTEYLIVDELSLPPRSISIVDVGAAFFGEKQLYQPLLDKGVGKLTSFEPDAKEFNKLKDLANRGSEDVVLNCALGDGDTHTLHLAPGGMTSFLEPDQDSYNLYSLFSNPPFSPVQTSFRKQDMSTTRLDDIGEIDQIDFLKVDVQGSELMILQNGRQKLADCSIVQIEMPFVSLYKNQPTFGDIDNELHSQGFMVHGFANIKRLPIHPYTKYGTLSGINQLVDLDMIYIRDIKKMDSLSAIVLKKIAVAAEICFYSFDLALRCLSELSGRGVVSKRTPERYISSRSTGRHRIACLHYTPAYNPPTGRIPTEIDPGV